MKKLLILVLILATCQIVQAKSSLPSGWGLSQNPQDLQVSALRIAIIDMDSVYQRSTRIIEAYDTMSQKELSVRRLLMTAESELRTLQQQDQESLESKRAEIQALIDQKVQALYAEKDKYTEQINADLKLVMNKLAKQGSYDLILDKAYAFSSQNIEDLTDEFVAQFDGGK